jgi:hypothetical protein
MAQTRHVTLTINSGAPNWAYQTNSFALGPHDTAELLNWFSRAGTIDIEKDGATFAVDGSVFDARYGYPLDFSATRGITVAGPAVISYRNTAWSQKGLVTFKITPDAFPPDKTFIIPDGTPGATVILECSTNLLTWTTATNGFYTGTNGAKFFRINAQRAQ